MTDNQTPENAVWLIMKRDLYYLPDSCGYTGVKKLAGRFTLDETAVRFPNESESGLSYIHEDDAPEFSKACYHDIREDVLRKERDALQARIDELEEANQRLTLDLGRAEKVIHEADDREAQPVAVVKPLEWQEWEPRPNVKALIAETPFGSYLIQSDHLYFIGNPVAHNTKWETLKSAAQADYERRILSALEKALAARVEALEWEDYPKLDGPVMSMAVTPLGTYFIMDDTDDFSGLYCELVSHQEATWYGTVKAARECLAEHQHIDDFTPLKELSQADYERRILSPLNITSAKDVWAEAAEHHDKQIETLVQEEGSYDHTTGQTEFPEWVEARLEFHEDSATALREKGGL